MKPNTARVINIILNAIERAKNPDDIVALSREFRELSGQKQKKEPRLKKKHDNLLGRQI